MGAGWESLRVPFETAAVMIYTSSTRKPGAGFG